MKHYSKRIKSPVGELTLIANANALVAILWENDKPNRVRIADVESKPNHPILEKTAKQLSQYFSGKRTQFEIDFEFYGTEFQKKVWRALTEIPYGETQTYLQIAKKIRSPKSCRAVGAANGKNPISLMVPCHRVIGSNGNLTGFAGGLKAKKYLLDLEKELTSVTTAS